MQILRSKRSLAVLGALALMAGNAYADPNISQINADPFFYTHDEVIPAGQGVTMGAPDGSRPHNTHSLIPHLPFYVGYMYTNYTYRFVNVAEQVMTMIGEGKHGLWRMQENGTVRQYLKAGHAGLAPNANPLAFANLATIQNDYSSYDRAGSWGFYKYPDEKLKDGKLQFVDMPISHPIFAGKYAKHEAIDLPSFYCTMSENDYPHAREAMNFVFSQPGANKVGPLGKRAGLDVKENYTNLVRISHMPDAKSWVNVGVKGLDKSYTDWKAVDTEKTNAEYYLVERPFFNHPYLFVLAVYDNKNNNDFSYVRPEGAYYDSLKTRRLNLKTKLTQNPTFNVFGSKGGDDHRGDRDDHRGDRDEHRGDRDEHRGDRDDSSLQKVVGLPVYGVHHPNRASYGGGGACPLKGGDWGRYPATSGGAAWPTQYEEVTPLCDGVLVDIKFTANLDGASWNDPGKYLANAAKGSKTVNYKMQPGLYGVFTEPYNVNRGIKNPDAMNVPASLDLHFPSVRPAVSYVTPPPLEDIVANNATPELQVADSDAGNKTLFTKNVLVASSGGMSPAGTSCKPQMQ
ncbi:MAG: hypothetical protein WBP13_07455 [Methylophilaceae bacterium]